MSGPAPRSLPCCWEPSRRKRPPPLRPSVPATRWCRRRTQSPRRSAWRRCWPAATPWTRRSRRRSRSPSLHPEAGNIGGGGFMRRPGVNGELRRSTTSARQAPAAATPTMFLKDGQYDRARITQGSPRGRRAGHGGRARLGLAGRRPAAVELPAATGDHARARRVHGERRARALARRAARPQCRRFPASLAQFSRQGVPYETGDVLKQPDLARTLERIARIRARPASTRARPPR